MVLLMIHLSSMSSFMQGYQSSNHSHISTLNLKKSYHLFFEFVKKKDFDSKRLVVLHSRPTNKRV